MKKKITIGSRGSKLALLYAQKVKKRIIEETDSNDDDIIIKKISTKGDEIQDIRLSDVGGKGLFSSSIEQELQKNNINIAVHALKDMPAIETKGLLTDTFLERTDASEIAIINGKKKFKDLKQNAVIGTSSYRRQFQIKKIRPDVICKLIRGNVDTRIKKLMNGEYDAIILSYAGVKYLELEDKISEIFPVEHIIPSAGQGIIAVQCKENDKDMISILKKINHQETYIRAHAERNILKILEGDCETAVGIHSQINENKITVEAELFSLDGTQRFYEKKSDRLDNFRELGNEIGQILKTKSNNSYKK